MVEYNYIMKGNFHRGTVLEILQKWRIPAFYAIRENILAFNANEDDLKHLESLNYKYEEQKVVVEERSGPQTLLFDDSIQLH